MLVANFWTCPRIIWKSDLIEQNIYSSDVCFSLKSYFDKNTSQQKCSLSEKNIIFHKWTKDILLQHVTVLFGGNLNIFWRYSILRFAQRGIRHFKEFKIRQSLDNLSFFFYLIPYGMYLLKFKGRNKQMNFWQCKRRRFKMIFIICIIELYRIIFSLKINVFQLKYKREKKLIFYSVRLFYLFISKCLCYLSIHK